MPHNKYNPTVPSKVARVLIGSHYEGKFKTPVRTVRDDIDVRINGSIVVHKDLSRRDKRRLS